ncbi:hypothetical protein BJX76DRAFT_367108 [Aspergillus varians]
MFKRLASPNERRTISREDLGFYNALVIAAIYEIENDEIDISSAQSFIPPLTQCILEHPFLGVVVKDKHTEKPSFEGVPSIDLNNHILILHNDQIGHDSENKTLEKILLPILDRPWPADIPPWRIIILPLAPPEDNPSATRCFIAFSFSHTLGDGMSGLAFHRTFLHAWHKHPENKTKHPSSSFLITPSTKPLPEPFDTPSRLPISWSFLLTPLIAAYLPNFLNKLLGLHASASLLNPGTWTGSPMFLDPSVPNNTRLRLLEVEAPLVQSALRASRAHGTKLTGTLHQMIVRALNKALPDSDNITNFASGTAIDMRGSIGVPAYTWGLYVSAHFDIHPRPQKQQQPQQQPAVSESESSESSPSPIPTEMWTSAARITKSLAECAVKLQDQSVGLLRYAPSIRGWMAKMIGARRDCSYRISNLLSFDGGSRDRGVRITKAVFATPADVTGSPLAVDVVSVKGGSLVCAVGWQVGALGMGVEEEGAVVDVVCESIREDFEELKGWVSE